MLQKLHPAYCRAASLAVLSALLGACGAGIGSAPPPRLPTRSAPLTEREQAYRQYELRQEVRPFADRWHRADGSYGFGQLDLIASQHDQTRAIFARTGRRDISLVLGTSLGVGCLLLPPVNALNASEEDKFSRASNIGFLTAGAAITGLVVALALWIRNPRDELADVYNAALRRDLQLP